MYNSDNELTAAFSLGAGALRIYLFAFMNEETKFR